MIDTDSLEFYRIGVQNRTRLLLVPIVCREILISRRERSCADGSEHGINLLNRC